jgi:hypothetical protein
MTRRVTRRQAIASGALSVAGLMLACRQSASAQIEGVPTLVMFHVVEGW